MKVTYGLHDAGEFFAVVVSPTVYDDIMTFETPRERYRYAQWLERYKRWLISKGKTYFPSEVGEFRCGWKIT